MLKALLKLLKPLDYVVIILSLALSFLPNIVTYYIYKETPDPIEVTSGASVPQEQAKLAIVKIDGQEVDRFSLYSDAPHEEKTYYPHDNQYNIVERKGTAIRVKEDNSPDQIAVMTSWIYRPGQVSICLPHNFIIEIHGENEEELLVLPRQ